ncbi:hypothetical protein PR202_gb17912 [Eleusine coracana subsp. coracana]|uniref:Uncharacterized protein n=1 Tax=Eleusine coracana subsp. coracana TaxID=191504 RepID=A0AAV5F4U8_ELECO|nr:hypothetical protein QOZ80_6BG0460750 [Eleusine coracana subsp. coracana]GJN29663.1 hypothetical protein PR202_gb17912 [Eleusine coracana subsp. coracana]
MAHYSFLTKLGFSTLTCNSLLAIYQSHDDPGSVAFVISSYAAIVLLFSLVRKLEGADRETRSKIHASVWALTTLLTGMFASKVAALMPQFIAVQVAVWTLSTALTVLFSSKVAPLMAPVVAMMAWAYAAALVCLAANLVLCVRRDDRAFLAFAHLNLLLLFWCARRFDAAPQGSAAHYRRARLAVWLLTASLTASFTWRMCALLPAPVAAAAWVLAAATVGGGFYLLFVRDAK